MVPKDPCSAPVKGRNPLVGDGVHHDGRGEAIAQAGYKSHHPPAPEHPRARYPWTAARPVLEATVRSQGWPAQAGRLLTVTHPADVVVTDSEDGSCGFGRHGDADRREVTPVEADLYRVRRHGDGRL